MYRSLTLDLHLNVRLKVCGVAIGITTNIGIELV